ncbi:MAG: cytochrome c biogenesis protein ResB [Bacteroidales bacterium]|nr:cytochrome c biogenesis protein ResB [Bacteroidales bacterium]
MTPITADLGAVPKNTPQTPRPTPNVWSGVKRMLKPLASLQLTVALFALSIALVFFGTIAQMNAGIWTIIDQYFWSTYVMVDLQLLVQFGQVFFGVSPDTVVSGAFPFPGGKTIGFALLVNLLAAHLVRFKLSWKRAGVITLHAGLVLLFVGEIVTRTSQVEQKMMIAEGETVNYAFDNRHPELAFVTDAGNGQDRMIVVPGTLLKQSATDKTRIQNADLPVDIGVDQYMVNSIVEPVTESTGKPWADHGLGQKFQAQKIDEVSGVDTSSKADVPSAHVTFYRKGTDEVLGRYLVTLWSMLRSGMPAQSVDVDGKAYDVALRFTRYYKPFTFKLIDFQFDRYQGTNKPKNFSSEIQLVDPEHGEDRTVTIRMNEPLRYRGEAFYQSGWDEATERGTVLQVVRNPGWLIPYISCAIVTLGMLIHFAMHLFTFLRRLREGRLGSTPQPYAPAAVVSVPMSGWQRAFPWLLTALAGLYLISAIMRPNGEKLNLDAISQLPVLDGGRLKPLDTVARVNLRLISHREELKVTKDGKTSTYPAIRWYLDLATSNPEEPGEAGDYQVFRIENDQLLEFLGLKARDGLRYSVNELKPSFAKLDDAARKAEQRPEKDRTLFDNKAMELHRHLGLVVVSMMSGKGAQIIPPAAPAAGASANETENGWRTPSEALRNAIMAARVYKTKRAEELKLPEDPKQMTPEQQNQMAEVIDESLVVARKAEPAAVAWIDMLEAYRSNLQGQSGSQGQFEKAVAEFQSHSDQIISSRDRSAVKLEHFLNKSALYYHCTTLYILAGLIGMLSWLAAAFNPGLTEAFRRSAFWVLVLTFLIHSVTLFARMYLMDRPMVFVTNLYSSAVFIGWAAAGICLLIERIFPIGLGNTVAAVLGFGTTVIAHNLALNGDTLEMMQAVLDTNFWLAVHVTTVTLGYSATYVAGVVGLAYVGLGLMTPLLKKPIVVGSGSQTRVMDLGRILGQVIYGIICLATLLSFFGTVSGGIWADQSWGRFWGWDPKENGAVLIVTWNALILHARWAGLVKDRGVAVLTLFGNMITTWSWFGTNQLQIGLHSYGFNKELIDLCVYVWAVHLIAIGLGLIPIRFWGSFVPPRAPAATA